MIYFPSGGSRISQGNSGTDKLFTGQRLDGTGLYYYKSPSVNPNITIDSPLTITGLWSGRYYDPTIGRFISADTIVPDPSNPQSLNRYSYVGNNPLKYDDPDGHFWWIVAGALIGAAVNVGIYEWRNHGHETAGGLANAFVSGAVAGGLAMVGMPEFAAAGLAGVGMSIGVGGLAGGAGYLAGKDAEEIACAATGTPDLSPPTREGFWSAVGMGAAGSAAGQVLTAGTMAGLDVLSGESSHTLDDVSYYLSNVGEPKGFKESAVAVGVTIGTDIGTGLVGTSDGPSYNYRQTPQLPADDINEVMADSGAE